MSDTDDWAYGMSEAEIAQTYNDLGDRSEFDESKAFPITGPRDTVISVRFSGGELALLERRAADADMKLTTYIRSAAMMNAQGMAALSGLLEQLIGMQQEIEALLGRGTPKRSASNV